LIFFKGWQRTSLIEYPGKISTVLFTGGCNFRCPFCYNPELAVQPQQLADLDSGTVLQYLEENAGLYQALVITGGEPTLNPDIPEFLARIKALGLFTGLETNGTNPGMVARLLEQNLVDYFAMDVKAPLEWNAYGRAAGLSRCQEGLLEKVEQTLELLRNARVEIELRCTVVPRLHTPEDILRLAGQLRGFPTFILQQFSPERTLDPRLQDQKPFDVEVLTELHRQMEPLFPRCELRGT
jgi:pyruvate formate lyase activating enzyme